MGQPAARVGDAVAHPLPKALGAGPGSANVTIGGRPAWRAVPRAAEAALRTRKATSDALVSAAENATRAAAGSLGAPAALAAENATKARATASMSNAITAARAGADVHQCTTPTSPAPVPHGPGVVINGSATVLINGLPAARQGDTVLEALGPMNAVAWGLPTVLIGG